jgi:hypothetical protein
MARVRDALGVELPLRTFFEAPTVAGLARHIRSARRAEDGLQTPSLHPVPRDRDLPLSFAQQRLWFLNQFEPDSPFYNMVRAVRLTGMFEAAALRQALEALVTRHESLRTTFPAVEGRTVQRVAAGASVALPVIDLADLTERECDAQVSRLIAEEVRRPFDLSEGPLLRTMALRLGEATHVLLLVMHHIISDAWSLDVLFRELGELYDAFMTDRRPALAALVIQSADYAVCQREWLQGDALDRQLAYWKRQLAGVPDLLTLPTDWPRPPVPSDRGQRQPWRAAEGLVDSVRELSQREGVTVFMTLLATFQALLCLHAKQEDIVVGSPIANRSRVETEGLIGFLINTLVLRTDLSGDPTFRMLLRRVRDVVLGAYEHQEVPFEKVVEALQPARALSHSPLFQVWFVVQTGEPVLLQLPGVTVSPLDVGHEAVRHDLRLGILADSRGLRGSFQYRTDLFEPTTIARMARHFDALLGWVVAEPDLRLSGLRALLEEMDRGRQAAAVQELMERSRRRLQDARRRAIGG